MANYASLKAAIQNVIKTNENNEITGALLQQSLLAMINSLSVGYHYAGIAVLTPSQTDPGTPDQNVFYIAAEPGIYSNFGSLVVYENEVAIFKYNGVWSKDVTGLATAILVDEINEKVNKKITNVVTHPYSEATIHGLPNFQTGIVDTTIPDSYKCSGLINIVGATRVVYTNLFPTQQNPSGNKWSGLVLYDANEAFVGAFAINSSGVPTSGVLDLTNYPNAKYLRFAPYYDSGGTVDTSAQIVITYSGSDDEILFESNIADDFLGGNGRVLSANKGKELYEISTGIAQILPSSLDAQSYYIAARYQQTPNGGMIQRKTDVATLMSKQIAIKCGNIVTLKTTSIGSAWAYYITDKYGIILSTNGNVSFDNSFVVEESNAAFICVNLVSGSDFSLTIEPGKSVTYKYPDGPFVLLQSDDLKQNSGNWTFGNQWNYSANGATPPASGNTNWMRNMLIYYSDIRTMRFSVIMGGNTVLMVTASYGTGITDGEGASAFCIDFAAAKIKMYGVPTYNYETGDAQPTSNGVDLNTVAEEIAIPNTMIGARKYVVEIKKKGIESIVTLYDTLTGQSVTAQHTGWFVGRQNQQYGFYCVSGSLPTISDFKVFGIYEPDIVFAGDSITEGVYVADRMKRYAELYRQQHPEQKVIISARGGQTIDGIMSLFESEWNIMRPKTISLLIGANGGNTQAKIQAFKTACDAIGAKLIVNYMTCIANGNAQNTNGSYLPALGYPGARFDIATAQNNAPNTTWANYNPALFGDAGIHPNINGQIEMYKRIPIDIGFESL